MKCGESERKCIISKPNFMFRLYEMHRCDDGLIERGNVCCTRHQSIIQLRTFINFSAFEKITSIPIPKILQILHSTFINSLRYSMLLLFSYANNNFLPFIKDSRTEKDLQYGLGYSSFLFNKRFEIHVSIYKKFKQLSNNNICG